MSQQQWYFDSANDLKFEELVEIVIRQMLKTPAQQMGADNKTIGKPAGENAWCEFVGCIQGKNDSCKGFYEEMVKALCSKMIEDLSNSNLINLLVETEEGQRWRKSNRMPTKTVMRAIVANELIRRVEIVTVNYFAE